ncbi:MAG: leucine--tRNA ligase [Bdellovibrionales bacterium]|nr:leucine--tRNA ligase [Bdellovibrionales bacterium]
MAFDHLSIEPKWQKNWDSERAFQAKDKSDKPKYYVLDMFPYPSSQGLHVGHPEGYTASDIVSRYRRAKGFNVLHPMGFDAFGLPAEQYAIQTGVHPAITTNEAINNFRRQLKALGFSFDWEREVSTCDPTYYKWTQFIFTILHKKGLAYQKEVPVNWCPALKTVLANEEVIDGKSERGGHPVVRMPMKQWMLKITAYAEKLLEGLDKIDWPDRTKEGQRNWIGKSEGAEIDFALSGYDESVRVFTTRPDTLFGVTFMVLAPEHPLVNVITTKDQTSEVKKYVEFASRKSEVDRQMGTEKTGAFTGAFAIHPLTKKQIPIWISDYVLMTYGTGGIMAVPAHDERDFEFAQKFDIPVQRVIEGGDLPYTGEGPIVNSEMLNGLLSKPDGIKKAIELVENKKIGQRMTTYKLRDWLFSRQRYWGEPFPIIRFPDGEVKSLEKNDLPVLLPQVADYEPSDTGESPLARNKEWVKFRDGANRETDTMPGSAGSSWYFLRYVDPKNNDEPFSFEKQKYWMPVDLYVGGPEHTVGHLLYARFWQKVLFDAGLVSHDEPFQKLLHQGMILGEDGEKMSKSRGNVINPDDVIKKYGADSLRVYEMFMGPIDKDKPWQDKGIDGVRRFLDRVWRASVDESGKSITNDDPLSESTTKLLHKTIKKVTSDIESLSFNTAISQMMIFVNEIYKTGERNTFAMKTMSQLLMPFAPHVSEEIWEKLGGEGLVALAQWPEYDEALVKDDVITLGVQVNGKMRGTIDVAPDAEESVAVGLAKELGTVSKILNDGKLVKVIYKPSRILNLIVK